MRLTEYVAGLFNISEDKLFTPTRKREVVDARNICSAILNDFTRATLGTIGKYFGGREAQQYHATALHRIRTARNLNETDREFSGKMTQTYQLCHNGLLSLPFEMVEDIPPYSMEEEYLMIEFS